MVDIKTNASDTLAAVSAQLEALRSHDYLTYRNGSEIHTRAVTVVTSGNTPYDEIVSEDLYQDIFVDAPLADLASKQFNSTNSYYASVSLSKAIGHIWNGRFSSSQLQIVRTQIAEAHGRGLKARYWDTPGMYPRSSALTWPKAFSFSEMTLTLHSRLAHQSTEPCVGCPDHRRCRCAECR